MITLLTEWLYVAAQMPHGTHAQQNVNRAVQRAGRVGSAATAPLRGAKLAARRERSAPPAEGSPRCRARSTSARCSPRRPSASARGPQPRGGDGGPVYPEASVISPSDPSENALEAFAKVVANLGWAEEAEKIVFAHTHQPLADVRASLDGRSPLLEHRLLDLRARPLLAHRLCALLPLRLAGDGGGDRRRGTRAAPDRDAGRPQPAFWRLTSDQRSSGTVEVVRGVRAVAREVNRRAQGQPTRIPASNLP